MYSVAKILKKNIQLSLFKIRRISRFLTWRCIDLALEVHALTLVDRLIFEAINKCGCGRLVAVGGCWSWGQNCWALH